MIYFNPPQFQGFVGAESFTMIGPPQNHRLACDRYARPFWRENVDLLDATDHFRNDGPFCDHRRRAFLDGALTDAHDEPRPQAGPPMVTIGSFMILVALMALCNIISSATPSIRCFREGIECNLVGRTSLDATPGIPKFVRLAWRFLSLQGFRSQRLRIPWSSFQGAVVSGIPMAYVLSIGGVGTNLRSGREQNGVHFGQSSLTMHPQQIADTLNSFRNE